MPTGWALDTFAAQTRSQPSRGTDLRLGRSLSASQHHPAAQR
jgi:hypothetical protein